MEKLNITFEELEAAAKPLLILLQQKADAHSTAIVTQSGVRIVRDEIGIPDSAYSFDKEHCKRHGGTCKWAGTVSCTNKCTYWSP